VVAIYDVGTHDGQLYLVSELLEGETLRKRLREGPIPIRKALEYALQIARGLAAVHRKGIAHRDLKPENLFIAHDGHVKILDFGLARLTAPAAASAEQTSLETELMTGPGVVMGTVGYMAPEQVRGLAADHRSDIFSFGVVLYEMLSGARPFRGESPVEVMNAILCVEPPDLAASTSPQLDSILKRCLEKSPEDRFDTARDLAFALETLSGDSRSHETVRSHAGKSGKSRFRKLPVAAGLIFTFLAGVAIAHWLWRPPSVEGPVPRYLTYSGRDSSPAVSPDGKTIAFASDRDGRSRIWLKQFAGGSEVPITSGVDDRPRFSPDGSTILFSRSDGSRGSLYRVATLGGDTRKIIDDVANGDFSPDGRHIAFVRWKNEGTHESSALGVVEVDGSDAKEIIEVDGRLNFPRWSPDGAHIAALGGLEGGFVHDTVLVVSADGKSKRSLSAPGGLLGLSSVAWTSNEEIVYLKGDRTAGESAHLVRQNIGSGASQSSAWAHQSLVLDIAAGAVVFDTQSGRSNLRELTLGRSLRAEDHRWLARGNSMDREPAYSPDGKRIVFSSSRSGNMDIWQIAMETGLVSRLTDHPGIDWDPVFTPDGKGVIWSSNRSGHPEIYLAEAEGGAGRQVTNDGYTAENPTITADGRWIVYSSAHVDKRGIWKIRPDGSGAARIAAGAYFNPEVSPDGQYALYVTTIRTDRNAIRVVRIEDGSEVPFEIVCDVRRQSGWLIGRARWMPRGGAIAFVGQDDKGVNGIYTQDFQPGTNTTASRRQLGGFDPEADTETLCISPDGTHMTISSWEQVSSIMIVEGVPGIPPLFKRQH
jgi:Tol biopolymer transport system component